MDDSNSDRESVSILSALGSLLRGLGAVPNLHTSSSRASPTRSSVFRELPREINSEVYEIRRPTTKPTLEIIFFHGFVVGDYGDAYWTDWLSEDGSHCWLESWLGEEFPTARVLSISYDSSLMHTSAYGRMDLHIAAENLVSTLIMSMETNVGRNHCPVILVGHSVGGLLMKKLMVMAAAKSTNTADAEDTAVLKNFLSNVKALFFYATPHNGSILAEAQRQSLKGPLMKYLEILQKDSSRLDDEFNSLLSKYKWKPYGVAESRDTVLGGFTGVVVDEASSRQGMLGNYYTVAADHINVCKPPKKSSSRFRRLVDFINSIVREVPMHQCQGLPDYPVGLVERALEFEEKLKSISILGIVGMGGIGKTTLAKQMFNDISKDFEYTCFAENVKGVQIHKLEKWLLKCFHRNGIPMDGTGTQWFDFKDKKTLIVMDDVDKVIQLRKFPKLHDFGSGSRMIITTRDKRILQTYEPLSNCEDVGFLNATEAKILFCQHAFSREDIPGYLIKHVQTVVEKCDGLPLTLEVMGGYLRGHETDPKVWVETIVKLGNADSITGERDDTLWDKLMVSYDALVPEEQEMFVDAANFFFEQPVEQALSAWSTTCGNSETRWANLVSRCMVKEVSQSRYNLFKDRWVECKRVWVHEQLRGLANKLERDHIESAFDEDVNKKVDILNANQVQGKTRILKLSHSGRSVPDKKKRMLRLEALGKLEKLTYMALDGVPHEGRCKNFPSKLSLLRWEVNPRSTSKFPINFQDMDNLAILELKNWTTLKALPAALVKLTTLRIITLWGLAKLEYLPKDFGLLSQLKCLNLYYLECLSRLPDSFGNLSSLEILEIHECEKLASLPDSFGNLLTSLKELTITNCPLLERLPDSFGNHLKSLKELTIASCPLLKRLPDSLSQLSGLQRLDVSHCPGLEELEASFGNLSALRSLTLKGTSLKKFPVNFVLLSALEELLLDNAGNFRSLADSFGHLTSLTRLEIRHAKELRNLPDDFGHLSSLTRLEIWDAKALRNLPDSLHLLASLQSLTIDAEKLETLPESLGQLPSLQELYLSVPSVKAFPASMGQLSSLRALTFASSVVDKLPETIGQLTSLQMLDLHLDCLKALPDSIGRLTSMRRLWIISDDLEMLPDSLGHCSSLEYLEIYAHKLESLPESIGGLSSLRILELNNVRSLKSLPASIGLLPPLLDLRFDCDGHEKFPDHFENFSCVVNNLTLTGWDTHRLPEGLENLSSLQELELEGILNLEILPEELGKLLSLRKLTVLCCPKLECLPDSLGLLSSFRELTIQFCRELKSLPDSLGRLSSLRQLIIQSCPNLKSLPHSLGNPSSPQLPLSLEERSNKARGLSSEESPQQTTHEGMRLRIYGCAHLTDSVLQSLGWVHMVDDVFGWYTRKWPQESNIPIQRHRSKLKANLVLVVAFAFLMYKFYSF